MKIHTSRGDVRNAFENPPTDFAAMLTFPGYANLPLLPS